MSENNTNKLAIVISFFAGGLVGAGLTMLLSPTSGKETREIIKDTSIKARDKAIEATTEARHKVDDIVQKGQEKLTKTKTEVQAAVEAGKKAYQHRKDELIEKVEKT
jgi:gas vesicle protein